MGEFFKKVKVNSLITAILYTALGLVLLFWPGLTADVFCMALGIVLIACGVVDVILFLAHRGSVYASSHLVLGIVLAVIGAYVMTQPGLVTKVVPRIIGVIVCIHGLGDVGDAVTLQHNGYARWGTALCLGLLTLALGAVLIYDPFDAFKTVVRIVGAFLVYDGISDIWIVSRVSRTLRQVKKDAEAAASAVDVAYQDVPDNHTGQ